MDTPTMRARNTTPSRDDIKGSHAPLRPSVPTERKTRSEPFLKWW